MSEQRTYKRLKQVLFFGIIGALFMPMVQHKFRFTAEKPLIGSYVLSEKPKITLENWFSGKYQQAQDTYITEHAGYRPGWVRLYNQWNYSLFNETNASGVIVGKENYLYEEGYIKAYYGIDFIGDEKIKQITQQLKFVQDTLKKKGIDFVVVFAPGKGSYYPEYIPDYYKHVGIGKTNYEAFNNCFKQQAINYIDMHSWFKSMKKTTKYPLFSKTGIHWSAYGQYFAVDSLTKYISSIRNYQIPYFVLDTIVESTKPILGDDDIGLGMNLFSQIPDIKLAYPKFHVNRKSKKNDPKILVIGDSFYWSLFNSHVSADLFNNGEFWYYNEQVYSASYSKEVLVKNQNLKQKLLENQVVVLLLTDSNLHRFGFGFVEQAYNSYSKKK